MSYSQCLGCNMVVEVYANGARGACACSGAGVRTGRRGFTAYDYVSAYPASAYRDAKEQAISNARFVKGAACDCEAGGGKRDALIHDQGCASQERARQAPLVEVCT